LCPSVAVAFNLTFQYIEDVWSLNDQFHSYIDSIYPNELEIKDTTECSISATYLDMLLKFDTNCKHSTLWQTGWFQFLHRQLS
jgi:hypothetical protein